MTNDYYVVPLSRSQRDRNFACRPTIPPFKGSKEITQSNNSEQLETDAPDYDENFSMTENSSFEDSVPENMTEISGKTSKSAWWG